MANKFVSKKQQAYEKLKDEILTNKLKTGEQLVERTICESLGVSRTPVREAFAALANEGLLDIVEGKGVFVSRLRFEDMVEIYDIRDAIECLSVRLLVDRVTAGEKDLLTKLYGQQLQALDEKNYEQAMMIDMNFHLTLAEMSKNKRLFDITTSIYSPISLMAAMTKDDKRLQLEAVEEHKVLLDAIMAEDTEGAVAAMHRHLENIKNYHTGKYYLFK